MIRYETFLNGHIKINEDFWITRSFITEFGLHVFCYPTNINFRIESEELVNLYLSVYKRECPLEVLLDYICERVENEDIVEYSNEVKMKPLDYIKQVIEKLVERINNASD